MIKDEGAFAKVLSSVNGWWESGVSRIAENYPKKRQVFGRLKDELGSRRALLVCGPRRVGKSVLLHQLIEHLLESGVEPKAITYYSLDDPAIMPHTDEPVKDLIEYGIARAGGKKAYIFFDEVQARKDWHLWVKAYYDRQLEVKFTLSGSSSLRIQADANKYLRGRITEIELMPLGFSEFLFFGGHDAPKIDKHDQASLAFAKRKLEGQIGEYLLVGGFPEWFEVKGGQDSNEKWIAGLLLDIPKKAIYEDVAVYFGIRNPKVLDLLLTVIAANQSRIISYEKLNEALGLDRATLLSYIEFLKSSYLVLEIPVWGSPKKQAKAMKKFLLIDQGLRNAILKQYELRGGEIGFAVENCIGMLLAFGGRKISYWRKQNREVDFVAGDIPVEVKYQNNIDDGDLLGPVAFLEENGLAEGIVITRETFGERKISGKRIRLIPFWIFALEPAAWFC